MTNENGDLIIHIGDFTWSMVVNVTTLSKAAGGRFLDLYTGRIYSDYPVTRAKKLLKLIYCYADAEDLNRVSNEVATNSKLNKYWRELMHE